jgi:hypothetical protein
MEKSALLVLVLIICTGSAKPQHSPDTRYSFHANSDYTLVKSQHGIDLYERWGKFGDKPAREVKARFEIKTSIAAAIALLQNQQLGTRWNVSTNQYKVLDVNADQWFGYVQYRLPWPVDNQDCVLRYTTSEKSGQATITFQSDSHKMLPEEKNVKRLTDVKGRWVLAEKDNRLIVEYYITSKPSATLPKWITDPIVRKNLIATLSNYKNILESQD